MTESAKAKRDELVSEHLADIGYEETFDEVCEQAKDSFKQGFTAGYAERDSEMLLEHYAEISLTKDREQKLVEALRFYADRKNWACNNVNTFEKDCLIVKDTELFVEYGADDYVAGKLARQTLRELGIEVK